MSEDKKLIRCEQCGATYSAGSKTCRSCGNTLKTLEQQTSANNLNGMPLKDWHAFIGKNSSYYVDIFKKNEHKSVFLSFNVGAFIFRAYWFFYRKMYKNAILLYVLSIILTLLFSFIGLAIGIPEVSKAREEYKPYTVYMAYDGTKTLDYPEDNEELSLEIRRAYWRYDDTVDRVTLRAQFMGLGGNFLVLFIVSFLSNWLYKEHILNHTARRKGYVADSGSGGVSLGSAIALAVFGESVINGIPLLVSTILLFIISGI